MLRFWLLLLVSRILAGADRIVVDDYYVTIEKGVLKSVDVAFKPTAVYLDLSNIGIREIDRDAFGELEIRYLTLSKNRLTFLPAFGFRSLRWLKHLSLAENNLVLTQHVFGGLNNLMSLDIRDNGIDVLHKGSFYGIANSTKILREGNSFGDITSKHYESPFVLLKLCTINGVVKSLKIFKENDDANDDLRCKIRIRSMIGDSVHLGDEEITGFAKGWYNLHGLNVKSLNLERNGITSITEEMLNDLPEGLTIINLAMNLIEYVKKGVIDNRNIRELDLRNNLLESIEKDAFANTENLDILLSDNRSSISILIENLLTVINGVVLPGNAEPMRYIVNAVCPNFVRHQ